MIMAELEKKQNGEYSVCWKSKKRTQSSKNDV